VYTAGPRTGSATATGALLEPIFRRHTVAAYICGHEHSLQHHVAGGPVHYFVSGAGSELTPVTPTPTTKFAVSRQGFLSVSLTGEALLAQFIDYEGKLLYRTSISRLTNVAPPMPGR
jgi:tartrate-resistant acid phosphatase type 5